MASSKSPNNACDREGRLSCRPTRRSPAKSTGAEIRIPPRHALFLLLLFLFAFPSALPAFSAGDYDTVLVPKIKTSVYIGSVTLTMTPLKRGPDEIYAAGYKAAVVPFFMFNESGGFRITFTNEQLARLERGERVEFSGDGQNKSGSPRPITGHVTADAPGAKTGKIKVRVFVTKKIALVFDSTYEFAATAEPAPAVAAPP